MRASKLGDQKSMTSPGFAERDPEGARRVLAWLDAASIEVVCGELVALADAEDLRPRLGELACPTLVCSGTSDQAAPPAGSCPSRVGCSVRSSRACTGRASPNTAGRSISWMATVEPLLI